MNRLGEIRYNNKGEKMIIIAYRGAMDIDVQFEDKSISYNKCYSAFKDGKIKHPIRYEESFAYHIEVELGIDLDDIWNWEKNNELGINPYKIYKQSNKKVWLYCLKHDYHNYDREDNKIGYEVRCNQFYKGNRCGYCASQKIHYKDSLAYNYPQVAKMIAIPENDLTFYSCYSIACKSDRRFYFKCDKCGTISNKKCKVNNIINYGFSCKYCSDGISIPNKFMSNLLKQLSINFIAEYSPYYFRSNQSVDFLLTDYNIIIEMDGSYGNHTREYDYWRDFLNMKYGGYKTIRIKLVDEKIYNNHKTFTYIISEILNSELSNLFNLNNINWNLIWEQCQKSKCVEAWELWNNGLHDTTKIGKILNINRGTVVVYLKRGVECKKCDYTIEESYKLRGIRLLRKNSKPVICITTKRIFVTITEAENFYNIYKGGISRSINEKRNYCGKLEDGSKLVWKRINWKHNKFYKINKEQI